MEIRLNRKQKIKQTLRKVGKEIEPTFTNIFNQDIAKKVLLHYISEVEKAFPPLLNYEYDSPRKFFEGLLIANPNLKPTQALEMVGFRVLLDEIGIREYRQIIKRYGDYYWYSLNKKMKKLKQADEINVFSMLREKIMKFEPLKLLANQDKMLNNDKYN